MCAQACHFHVATGDPKYTPAYKLEPLRRAYLRHVRAAARLAEDAQSLLAADATPSIASDGIAETRALADVINQFASQRAALRNDILSALAASTVYSPAWGCAFGV